MYLLHPPNIHRVHRARGERADCPGQEKNELYDGALPAALPSVRPGTAGLMLGLDDPKGLFQPKLFSDSMNLDA